MIEEVSGDLLQWLRGFYFVAQKGGVRQATVAMGREQPTITRHIKCLEKELGVALFDRSSRKMKLTPEGKALFRKAVSLFEDVKEIKNGFRQEELEQRGRIVIATSYAIIDSFLPPYIMAFRKTHPHVSFHMIGGVFETVYEKIELGEADFGIAFKESAPDTMVCYDLFETGQVLITPKSHTFFKGKTPTLEQIAQTPLILFSHTGWIEPFIEKIFSKWHLKPNLVMTHNSFVTVKKYVALGTGVALLGGYAVSDEDKKMINIYPMDQYFPKRRMDLMFRRKQYISPSVKAFIRTLKPDIRFTS